MFPELKKLSIYGYLLFFLCIFHLSVNLIWINLNKLPFPWDQAGHTTIAYKFLEYFSGGSDFQFLRISDYYPPFVHLVVSSAMLIFGSDPNIGPIIITLFFILSIVFLYLYSDLIFKNKLAAFAAAVFYSFLPVIYNDSRYFLLEIPLVAMVLGSLYFLKKTQHFENKKYNYAFAIFSGLALLTKWAAAIYLFIPILLEVLQVSLNFREKANKQVLKNFLNAVLIIFVINFLWYSTNLETLLNVTKITASPEESDPQRLLSLENLKYYFHQITNFQLTWLGMVAFLYFLPGFLGQPKTKILPIIGTLAFTYSVFTIIANKDLRYVIALAPLISIIVGFGLVKLIKESFLKGLVVSLVLFAYYLNYFFSLGFGFPIDPIKDDLRNTLFIPLLGGVDLINLGKDSSYYLAPKFSPTKWPNLTITEEMSRHNPSQKVDILIICEKPFFNQVNMEQARRQLKKNKVEFFAPYSTAPLKEDEIDEYLGNFDLVLVANNDLGPQGGIRHIERMKQLKNYLESGKGTGAEKINTYPLPDGDSLSVYKIGKWPNKTIVEEMSKHDTTKKVKILLTSNKPRLNSNNLENLRKELKKEKIEFFSIDSSSTFSSDQQVKDYLSQFDVILLADEDFGNKDKNLDLTSYLKIKSFLQTGDPNFIKINTYFLPDNNSLSVIKTIQTSL